MIIKFNNIILKIKIIHYNIYIIQKYQANCLVYYLKNNNTWTAYNFENIWVNRKDNTTGRENVPKGKIAKIYKERHRERGRETDY